MNTRPGVTDREHIRTNGIHTKRRFVGQIGTRPSGKRFLADAIVGYVKCVGNVGNVTYNLKAG